MAKQPRFRAGRRAIVLASAAAAVVVLIVVAYFGRRWQLDSAAVHARDAGRAAFAAGDFEKALDGFGRYVRRFEGRSAHASDFVAYARARRRVELPDGAHLKGAIAALSKALALDRSNAEAQSDLLEIYVATGRHSDALEMVDSMLLARSSDVGLLRTKRDVLDAMTKYADALAAADRVNRLAPDDLADHVRTLDIMSRARSNYLQVDSWLGRVLAAHEGDARFGLLTAAVLGRRGDGAKAKESLDRVLAATAKTADPDFALLLVAELDKAARFDESVRVMKRAPAAAGSPLARETLRRDFFAGDVAEVIAGAKLRPDDLGGADAETLAVATLALCACGRGAESEPIRRELGRRQDREGRAWSAVVEHGRDGAARKGLESVTALKQAIVDLQDRAVAHCALGDARLALDERDLAVAEWTRAAELAPSWGRPRRMIASTLLRTPGRGHVALNAVREALERAPRDPETNRTWIAVIAWMSRYATDTQVPSLLDAVRNAVAIAPTCAADALPVEIELLIRADKAEAERRLQAVVATKPVPDGLALLTIAGLPEFPRGVSRTQLLDLVERTYGVTPRLALTRAALAVRSDGDDAGLREFDALRARGAAGAAEPDWDTARAMLLDAMGRAEAGPAWIALADAREHEIRPQMCVLASPTRRADRGATARVIDRVRALTGDDGVEWRIARAEWLLGAPRAPDAQVSEAASMLGDVVKAASDNVPARRLLAAALERLGNLAEATEQLRKAAKLSPADTSTLLENARLAQSQGRPELAERVLDAVLASPGLAPQSAEQAACLLASRGDVRRAIALLEPYVAGARVDRRATLLLVRLLLAAGEPARAVPQIERLLSAPDPEIVDVAASVYEALDKRDDATASLARLDSIAAPPGERELIRGRHAARANDRDGALAWFRKAAEAAPERSDAWTALLVIGLLDGDAPLVDSVLSDPRASAASEPSRFLAGERATVAAALGDARLRGLVISALDDRPNRAVLLQAARKAASSAKDEAGREEAARVVRAFAEAHQDVLAILLLSAELCASAGDLNEACEVARLACRNFPNSVPAARRLAEFLAAGAQWDAAVAASLQWRERAKGNDAAADLFAMRAMLTAGRAADVVSTFDARARAAVARPDADAPLLILHAVALMRTGRSERAAEILATVAAGAPNGRVLALEASPRFLGDAKSASAWIAACALNVRAGDPAEQLALARAWAGAWQTFGAPEFYERATSTLAAVIAAPDAPAAARFLRASLAHQKGDLATARREYAAAVAADAHLLDAKNNLAMLLADAGEWEQAVALATELEKSRPKHAEYLDTLAYALRKGRQFQRAKERLEHAVELEPANPSWKLSLAECLVESGDVAAAASVVASLNAASARGVVMPADAKRRIEKLRIPPR